MLLGATILCFLVLLALLADRLGNRVWHGGSDRVFYRCEACDLRYPRRDVAGASRATCPAGHPVVLERSHGGAGAVVIFVCLGFLAVATALMATGIVPY